MNFLNYSQASDPASNNHFSFANGLEQITGSGSEYKPRKNSMPNAPCKQAATYNAGMNKNLLSLSTLSLWLALGGVAHAQEQQTPPAPAAVATEATPAEADKNTHLAAPQRSVRTHQQDAGSRIEELKVGGETQTITVQPSGTAPAYQVRPSNNHSLRQEEGHRAGSGTNGPRVWNLMEF